MTKSTKTKTKIKTKEKDQFKTVIDFIKKHKNCGVWHERGEFTLRKRHDDGHSDGIKVPSTMFIFLARNGFFERNCYIGFKPYKIYPRAKVIPDRDAFLKIAFNQVIKIKREDIKRTHEILNLILTSEMVSSKEALTLDKIERIGSSIMEDIHFFKRKPSKLAQINLYMSVRGFEFLVICGPRYSKRKFLENIKNAVKNVETILNDRYLDQKVFLDES